MNRVMVTFIVIVVLVLSGAFLMQDWFLPQEPEIVYTLQVPDSGSKDQIIKLHESTQGLSGTFDIVNANDGRGSVVTVETYRTPVGNGYEVVPFGVNYGGSGTFIYLGLFKRTSTNVEHVYSYALVDRAVIDSISVREPKGSEGEILVEYRIHSNGQALSENPNEAAIAAFTINNNELIPTTIFDRAAY